MVSQINDPAAEKEQATKQDKESKNALSPPVQHGWRPTLHENDPGRRPRSPLAYGWQPTLYPEDDVRLSSTAAGAGTPPEVYPPPPLPSYSGGMHSLHSSQYGGVGGGAGSGAFHFQQLAQQEHIAAAAAAQQRLYPPRTEPALYGLHMPHFPTSYPAAAAASLGSSGHSRSNHAALFEGATAATTYSTRIDRQDAAEDTTETRKFVEMQQQQQSARDFVPQTITMLSPDEIAEHAVIEHAASQRIANTVHQAAMAAMAGQAQHAAAMDERAQMAARHQTGSAAVEQSAMAHHQAAMDERALMASHQATMADCLVGPAAAQRAAMARHQAAMDQRTLLYAEAAAASVGCYGAVPSAYHHTFPMGPPEIMSSMGPMMAQSLAKFTLPSEKSTSAKYQGPPPLCVDGRSVENRASKRQKSEPPKRKSQAPTKH